MRTVLAAAVLALAAGSGACGACGGEPGPTEAYVRDGGRDSGRSDSGRADGASDGATRPGLDAEHSPLDVGADVAADLDARPVDASDQGDTPTPWVVVRGELCGDWPEAAAMEDAPGAPNGTPALRWVHSTAAIPRWGDLIKLGPHASGELVVNHREQVCFPYSHQPSRPGCLDMDGQMAWTSSLDEGPGTWVAGGLVVAPDDSLYWVMNHGALMTRSPGPEVDAQWVVDLWPRDSDRVLNGSAALMIGPRGLLVSQGYTSSGARGVLGVSRCGQIVWEAQGVVTSPVGTPAGVWLFRNGQQHLVAADGRVLATVGVPGKGISAVPITEDSVLFYGYELPYDHRRPPANYSHGVGTAPRWQPSDWVTRVWLPLRVTGGADVVGWRPRDPGELPLAGPLYILQQDEEHQIPLPGHSQGNTPIIGRDASIVVLRDTTGLAERDLPETTLVVYETDGTERYRLLIPNFSVAQDPVISAAGLLLAAGTSRVSDDVASEEVTDVVVAIQTNIPGHARLGWSREAGNQRGSRAIAGP